MSVLDDILAPLPFYRDGGAGAWNAAVLRDARLRPAFFDSSCLMYRLMYAKVNTYVKDCGADVDKMCHTIAADVMTDIADACRNFACAPVMAFDSDRSLRREQLYPSYKEKRGTQKVTEKQKQVLSCKNEVKRLLRCVYGPGYGVQGFCYNGYEGDDIIASFVLGLKQTPALANPELHERPEYDKPVVIVSSDHDLHQVVMDGVMFADVGTGVLADASQLEKHYGIACRDVVASKCVGGCKSDEVGNVPGCGDVTVAEFLAKRNFDVTVPKARAMLNSPDGEAVLRRNLRLVRLPFDGDPLMQPLRLSPKVWPKIGVPEDMAALMDGNGVPRSAWPSFADVGLPRAENAVPVCQYVRKVRSE